MKLESWGSPVDQEIWARLLAVANDDLKHRLWCAVIREVATAALGQNALDDSAESEAEELVNEWQNDALPSGNNLAWVLGELDYFRDIDLSWNEKICLSGNACGDVAAVVCDLTGRLEEYPDAREAVTEEAVEDFYVEWRTRFLCKVPEVAQTFAEKKAAS